jgi:thiosulfate reductase cytochrome b subunit
MLFKNIAFFVVHLVGFQVVELILCLLIQRSTELMPKSDGWYL